ncbi:hypothetical protein A1O3_01126 [Capronia epimyces CBS 606.96]|uniref:Uncharacterized protein n=1 Tax=Capronia epimyces CBS 606.96 TaxID=1182542 RepID=W9ZDI2_9EURO|nr:uncharacterized protein A1O3_01126 [Capronia epimyces CBS 606.96]EXJ92574.1 hypothetical protein A1O3_01126 [Capronia epimyces CBS 606.96]
MRFNHHADASKKGRGGKRRVDAMSIINLLNGTPTPAGNRRYPPRDKYDQEEGIFIWYNRIDLGLSWNRVQENFKRQFHKQRGKAGLQCKYYRVLTENHVQKVRDQGPRALRRPYDVAAWGVIAQTSIRYPWMLPYHQLMPKMMKCKL